MHLLKLFFKQWIRTMADNESMDLYLTMPRTWLLCSQASLESTQSRILRKRIRLQIKNDSDPPLLMILLQLNLNKICRKFLIIHLTRFYDQKMKFTSYVLQTHLENQHCTHQSILKDFRKNMELSFI